MNHQASDLARIRSLAAKQPADALRLLDRVKQWCPICALAPHVTVSTVVNTEKVRLKCRLRKDSGRRFANAADFERRIGKLWLEKDEKQLSNHSECEFEHVYPCGFHKAGPADIDEI